MSKNNSKYDYSLPKHQNKIVLCLAAHEPMTMSGTNRKVKGEATSTNRAFHELQTKAMITETGALEYRGRRFLKYWLSQKGIAYALLNGSNPNTVRTIALETVKNDAEKKILEIYFELRSISPRVAINLDRALLHAGNLDAHEQMIELTNNMSRAFYFMTETEEKRFRNILNKSTDFKKTWKEFLKKLEEFSRKERESLGVED